MEALTLVVATALVALGALAVTSMLRLDSALDVVVTFGVLATGEIALLTGVAGAIGHLRPGTVLVLDVLVAVTSAWLARHRLAALPRPRVRMRRLRSHPWVAALAGVAVLALAWQALVALVLPVYAYDALTYHGTTLATWLQRGDIAPPALSTCCSHYANTAELLSVWPMLLLGSDTVVDAVQLPFVLLGAASVAGLARSVGLDRASAAGAAALFAVTPVVLAQASTNYVDVMVAAWSLAALHGLVRYAAAGSLRQLVAVGVAGGLLLGTKGTGIVWGAAIAVVSVAVVVARARGRSPAKGDAWRAVVLVLGLIASLGSFWYLRNWLETGNPLHPFHIRVAGVEVFEGPTEVDEFLTLPDAGADVSWPEAVVRSWAADLDFWNQGPYDYQQRAGGLGPAWAWLGLPLLIPVGIVLLRRRNVGALAYAVVGAVFLVQPYRWWSRFTIQLAAVGAVAVVAAIAWLPSRAARTALRSAALSLAVVGVALTTYAVNPASRAQPLGAIDLLALTDEPVGERTVGRLFFPEYRFVDAMPSDATVVVDLPAEPVRFLYPLFGRSWTRRVLPADASSPPADAWIVTGVGRPLDARMQHDDRFVLDSDVRGVRVWRPRNDDRGR